MQDPTPLKEAGGDSNLVELLRQYIDLQVVTLDTLLRGDLAGSEECAHKSNLQLQKIAEHIGYDYMGTMQERIDAFTGE